MDLLYNKIVLYNRIILYNRTISSLVLFIFTGVTFRVFDIIYFRLALKALSIGRFSWWMCFKNEIRTNVLSLKSSNFSKFYPNSLKFCACQETTAVQKRAQDFHKSEVLAQTNQIKYDCFFLHGIENIKKLSSQNLKLETKIPGTFF